MEAGQLLVLLLSFCALALHIKNRRNGQNKITFIITLPDAKTGRGKEQPDV